MRPDPAYLGYRAGSALARALPGPAVGPATRALGAAAELAMPDRKLMVERNLRRAYGPDMDPARLPRRVRAAFEYYTRYWVESFRLPGTSATELTRGITHEGWDHVQAGLDDGLGAILAMPHLGGWEWAAFWIAETKRREITAVVEPVDPPELAEWFVGLRRQFGINVVPLGPSAGPECLRALRSNQILCLLCDRDIAGTGVSVDFFGERTTLPGGPATLALRTGAPLLPTAVYFDGTGHHGIARPPMDTARRGTLRDDVARVTQDLATELEELIRAEPEQWHLMQPNWPSDHEALDRRSSER